MNKHNNTKIVFTLTLITILLCVIFAGCTPAKVEGIVFGTYYSIQGGKTSRNKIKNSIYILSDLEELLSTNINTSQVAIINDSKAGVEHKINSDFEHLFNRCKEYNIETPSFNPAIFPLVELWNLSPSKYVHGYEPKTIPDNHEIAKLLPICKYNNFKLINGRIIKNHDNAKIDFGAIAKGYAVDKVFNKMKDDPSLVVNIGGTIKTNRLINVDILHPRKNSTYARLELKARAIATSGDYNRYYMFAGKRYHHILDENGYPAGVMDNDPIISVTVIGNSAETCDYLSTSLMTLNNNKIELLMSKKEYLDYGALVITENHHYQYGKKINFEILN